MPRKFAEKNVKSADSATHGSENGSVWTTSGIRKFWLVNVRGYAVSESHILPKSTLLGEIVFKRRWRLVRRDGRP